VKKNLTEEKKHATDWIESHKSTFYLLSDAIWSYAELGMEEYQSSKAIAQCLKNNGFEIEMGVADMPTAFVATSGAGKPVIALSCEYDALPGLSQERAANWQSPIIEGAPGHGCGHNLLGVAEVMAAIAIKNAVANFNLPGTVKVFGTPAEELCIGKPYMARAGLFDGLDAVIDWHPGFYNLAAYDTCSAYFNVRYHFKGRTAHGNAPWHGRSALDAAILMGHMIEMLREHTTPGSPPEAAHTINYSFPDVGPAYPSVVPDRSTLWCVGRIVSSDELEYVMHRLEKCSEAAAMATETSVEIQMITATHEKIPSKTVSRVIHDNFQAIGAPEFTQDESEFAKKMQRDLGVPESGLDMIITAFGPAATAVCDTSEYSWLAPYGTLWVTSAPGGIGWHNWQIAGCASSTIGKKAMDVGAMVLAASGIDLLTHPEILSEARRELNERLNGRTYRCLVPDTVKPPILINRDIMDRYRPLQQKHYQEP